MILMKLERQDKIPLYEQIVKQVQDLIEKRILKPGQKMPATRVLAERLGINRSTVYKAYEELWALGYIDSRPGSYSLIRKRPKLASQVNTSGKGLLTWGKISSSAGQDVFSIFKQYRPEATEHQQSDIINLALLEIDARLFPVDDFRRCINTVLIEKGTEVLRYGEYQGYRPLREYMARRMQIHGIDVSAEEILITNGSQNGIELVLKLLSTAGERILVESPTYANIIPLLKYYQTKIIGLTMQDNGIDLGELKSALKKYSPAFLYTIPNFHNPTGITTDQAHREELLSLCEKYQVPIVEDGFEEEMKYFGKVPLPIKSMDKQRIVIYLGTFSKVLFPGLRIGWMVAERDCIQRLNSIKRFCDLTSSSFIQAILHEFCQQGYYDLHIKRMHRVFRKRMQVAMKALREYIPANKAKWTEPSGGYLIWFKIKNNRIKATELKKILTNHGVHVSPGEYYFHLPPKDQHFRISISNLDEKEITEGIRRLGKAISEM